MKSVLTPLALGLLATAALAQDLPADQRLKDLERKVEILSRELEAQKTGGVVAPADEKGTHGLAPAASKIYATKSGLSIGGYGEMVYEQFDGKLQNGTYAPKANTVDFVRQILYVGYKFSDRIVFNSEIEFEHAKASNSANDPGEVAVEFAYLDFLLNPAVNLRAGMMLVPMGFVNELHEPPVFLGAKRPTVENQIIPTTWRANGVGIHGDLPGHFSYRLYLMEGLRSDRMSKAGIRGGRQNGGKALAEGLAITGRLDWAPLPGTTFGVSFFRGNSNQADPAGVTEPLTTQVVDVHAEWRYRGLQVRGLFARVTNSEAGVRTAAPAAARELGTRQFGGYAEVGYDTFNGRFGKQALIPFVRAERLNPQQEVAGAVVADRALDQTILTTGVVYKPIPQIAVKLDVQKIENRARTGRNQMNIGLGYYF